MSRTGDSDMLDLFVRRPVERTSYGYGSEVAGAGDVAEQISRVVAQALRDAKAAGLTRDDVGRRMAEFGIPVAKGSIDKWASEAEAERCIRLDAFIALIHATDAKDALGWLASLFGLAMVSADMLDLIQLHEIRRHREALEQREKVLLARARARR